MWRGAVPEAGTSRAVPLPGLPNLLAHEGYPGHHTEHCRKEQLLVGAGHDEQSIFLVNTPQCLMAEGLADHALAATAARQEGAAL